MKPAIPKFDIGDTVIYSDHQNRRQTGVVQRIKAQWNRSTGEKTADINPFIIYTITHPTYRNNVMHTSGEFSELPIFLVRKAGQ